MLNYSMQNMLKLLLNFQVLYQQQGLKTELECPEMLMVGVSSFFHQKICKKYVRFKSFYFIINSSINRYFLYSHFMMQKWEQ